MKIINKNFCCSSYLAFRFIVDENVEFFESTEHHPYSDENINKVGVNSAIEIDKILTKKFAEIKNKRKALMLSGGMDSAILASYMRGSDAYTFRFNNGEFGLDELHRAEYYAKYYGLNLHYVDINFDKVDKCLDKIMISKGAPVHSIEPQIYLAAIQAKNDGNEVIIVGESADDIFGGLDKLLSKDWTFDDFIDRFTYLNPSKCLKNPIDFRYLYEPYRKDNEYIDYQSFLQKYSTPESDSSYYNAFNVAGIEYIDSYACFYMKTALDLNRIRNGESKYLIRELFKMKYPNYPIPEKIPMPRPVDKYFENWDGPKRKEFLENLDMKQFNGNQKWQLYCLERFLNLYDSKL